MFIADFFGHINSNTQPFFNINMKKSLLLSAAALAVLSANAETKSYSSDELGIVGGVSNNGRYVAIYDDENSMGYLWDAENPEEFKLIDGVPTRKVQLYDVSDDGLSVGNFYQMGGTYIPCYVTPDGEVHELTLSQYSLYDNSAVCVNADASIITGYQHFNDPSPDIPGKYTPCQWYLNDNGEYDMVIYSDIEYPAHQGFIPRAASEDGRIIAGRLYCGAGSEIPAMIVDGELKIWATLETKLEEFYYKDKLLGLFENYYVDGYLDGATGEYFSGEISDLDAWGNAYGYRTQVENLNPEDGSGTLRRFASIYDIENDEWIDYPTGNGLQGFTCGINRHYVFSNGNRVMISTDDVDEVKTATGEFDFTTPASLTGIMRCSLDGKVLGAVTQVMNPATGENQYFPLVIVLDEPLETAPESGIEFVKDNDMTLLLSAGRIDIANGEGVVYDLNGRLAGKGSTIRVAPGTYVVKVGEASRKVLVK